MGEREKKQRFDRLTGPHLLWASTMGATFDLGIMSKAMLTPSMKTAAQRLALHLMQKKEFPFVDGMEIGAEMFEYLFKKLNDFLYFSDSYLVEFKENVASLKINRDGCMYCPTGVGGAQLGFAVCPYPHLFEVFLDIAIKNSFYDKAIRIYKGEDGLYMREEGEWDVIDFHVEEDAEYNEICKTLLECKSEVEEAFERALRDGFVTSEDLWDRNYIPVEGTDPPKYETRFTEFAKKYIQPIEDACLEKNRRFIFVVLVDENGYLPAHNTKYDKPLTGDYKTDLIGNRSRRIFDDPTGLAAARNLRKILLQPYPRDVGVLMYDISTPVFFEGKHWGGLRIGFK